jgi:hypothetical protein
MNNQIHTENGAMSDVSGAGIHNHGIVAVISS